MVGLMDVKYLTRSVREYNGKSYYNITVMQGDDVMRLPCSDVVYSNMSGQELKDITIHIELREYMGHNGMNRSWTVIGADVGK